MTDPLHTLLKLRQRQEQQLAQQAEDAQRRLKELTDLHRPALTALADAEQCAEDLRLQLNALPDGPCSLAEARRRELKRQEAHDQLSAATRGAEGAQPALDHARAEAEAARDAWLAARADHAAIQHLCEQRDQAAQAARLRRQEREDDDLQTHRHSTTPRSAS